MDKKENFFSQKAPLILVFCFLPLFFVRLASIYYLEPMLSATKMDSRWSNWNELTRLGDFIFSWIFPLGFI